MLVFVQSIDRARELFHELVYEGINVDVIHADRTQQQVHPWHSVCCVAESPTYKLIFIFYYFFIFFILVFVHFDAAVPERQRGEQFPLREDLGADLHGAAGQRNRLQRRQHRAQLRLPHQRCGIHPPHRSVPVLHSLSQSVSRLIVFLSLIQSTVGL